MRRYLVRCEYHAAPLDNFLCEGDDAMHAVEQARDVYPTAILYTPYELVLRADDEPDLAAPKGKMIIAWLSLDSGEWAAIPASVKVKLWDALVSKRST